MLQITPHMRILVAVEPVDGRKGIDSLAQLCRQKLAEDPFSGTVFLFLNKRRTIMRALVYDGGGFWLCQKRLSQGSFKWWPKGESSRLQLESHQVQTLFANGDPFTRCASPWRRLSPRPPQELLAG